MAHNGVTVPYQLHACPPVVIELDDDDRTDDEGMLDDIRDEETGITEEPGRDELEIATLDAATLEVTTVLQ
ncbi:MAG TPA: hypothetical protein VIM59_13470, partial [Cellvibrio sp.]